jgi:biotin synthase
MGLGCIIPALMSASSLEQLEAIYNQPFFKLIDDARATMRKHWPEDEMQLCTLLSIKTGGCSEDCAYCSQSGRSKVGLKPGPLMNTEDVMKVARLAKAEGSTRFCMGAAWKGVKETDKKFQSVLETIRAVSELGMEVCVTLGQISEDAAHQLKDAGVTAYNHNLDTSEEYYSEIITTHTYKDRLETIQNVQAAGMSVCCGGIIGMGETVTDRLKMLEVLTKFNPAPESVPINCLVPIEGTRLNEMLPEPPMIDILELVRLIATTRIALPTSKVRLSAGRRRLTKEGQTLCFLAGANSIFIGDRLLTTDNADAKDDAKLLSELNISPLAPVLSQPA